MHSSKNEVASQFLIGHVSIKPNEGYVKIILGQHKEAGEVQHFKSHLKCTSSLRKSAKYQYS